MNFGYLNFILSENHGAMLGLFAELPPVLKTVAFTTIGAFLISVYAIVQFLMPIKSIPLRLGLSLQISGIMGNVTDRIVWGHVIDFINFMGNNWTTPVFNFADMIQWIGNALIITSIYKEKDILWPKNDFRHNSWINQKFQLRYCFNLITIGISLVLICLGFSYAYLRLVLQSITDNNAAIADLYLRPFLITSTIICMTMIAIVFIVGKLASHRIAGPVYAIERFLKQALEGSDKPLRLRQGDELKQFEELSEKIIAVLKQNPERIKQKDQASK